MAYRSLGSLWFPLFIKVLHSISALEQFPGQLSEELHCLTTSIPSNAHYEPMENPLLVLVLEGLVL